MDILNDTVENDYKDRIVRVEHLIKSKAKLEAVFFLLCVPLTVIAKCMCCIKIILMYPTNVQMLVQFG